jgi:hypothetical protein
MYVCVYVHVFMYTYRIDTTEESNITEDFWLSAQIYFKKRQCNRFQWL